MKKIKVYKFERDIKIVGLCDVHIGSKFCDMKSLKETIEYIRRNKRVYWFLDGDVLENIVPGKIDPYNQEMTPDSQLETIVELLKPIANRGLFAFDGNHVGRTKRVSFFNLMKTICFELGIDYLGVGGYVSFKTGKQSYTLALQHGSGGGSTRAGSFNELRKMMNVYKEADIYALGHDHRLEYTIEPSLIINKKGEEELVPVFICRTGSYLQYADYAREKLYSPHVQGSLSIHLFDTKKKITITKLVYLNGKPIWKTL